MQINEYVNLSKRTIANLNNPQLDNLHMVLGMLTEVGELADQFKKNLAYKREIDYTNVQEEVGDLMFYVAGLCSVNHFDLENILEKNVKKLCQRYPEKFTEYAATHRNLEKEREILES
jgi:NTP pyrophosphatase (non-canonical NTP hydrolase)